MGLTQTTPEPCGSTLGLPLCAGAACIHCAGRVWSISTLHVGPDQPDPRPNPNANPNPTPNPIPNPSPYPYSIANPDPNPNPSWGSRSSGAITWLRRVFRWHFCFSKKRRATERTAFITKTRSLDKEFCASRSCK